MQVLATINLLLHIKSVIDTCGHWIDLSHINPFPPERSIHKSWDWSIRIISRCLVFSSPPFHPPNGHSALVPAWEVILRGMTIKLINFSHSLAPHHPMFSCNLTQPVSQYNNHLIILHLIRSSNGSSCWISGTEIESPDSFFPASLSSPIMKAFFPSNPFTLHFYAVFIFSGLLHARANTRETTGLDHFPRWKRNPQANKGTRTTLTLLRMWKWLPAE